MKKKEIFEISENTQIEKYNASMENSLVEARYSLTLEEQRFISVKTVD